MGNVIFFPLPLWLCFRKREEENKRRESEQQKGRLSPDSCRPQAPPCLPGTQAEPPGQSGGPSKQPPASHAAQSPERRICRGSVGRAPEQHLSPDLQGTDPRKPNGRCIAFVIQCRPVDCGPFYRCTHRPFTFNILMSALKPAILLFIFYLFL